MKIFMALAGVTLSAVMGVATLKNNNVYSANSVSTEDFFLDDVEALSSCESIGWWNNDGNCVHNGRGVYFCKTDDVFHLTDCKI